MSILCIDFPLESLPFLSCHSLQSPFRSSTPTQIHSLVPPLNKDLTGWRFRVVQFMSLHNAGQPRGPETPEIQAVCLVMCPGRQLYTPTGKGPYFFARSLHWLAPPCAPWLCGHRGAPFSSPQKGARSTSTVSDFPNLCHELPFVFKNSFWLENSPTPPGHERNCPKMILGSHSTLMRH